ncbi:MAG: hypothetical protein O2955_13180 [Planctomycetota bacterium]|nr:hypothetical protein [Planctomycetota bacterium]MDA1213463.1 hypothetical protein [Planctomycetota bacterium]
MEFEQRLQRAIDRGSQTREKKGQEAAAQAMSEEDLKNLHTRFRLELSEHIEACLRQVSDHFPGFQVQTAVRDGWGAKITRDEFSRTETLFSLLEMVVRPYSPIHIVELAAKGTIRNKEIFHRNHFQPLTDVNLESFKALIDQWVLEFAELYSATA